jgi:hypothetical protein
MFRVTGTIDGSVGSVSWEDGDLVRDAEDITAEDLAAVLAVHFRASRMEGRAVGPITGPHTMRDHLSDPLSALFIIYDTFDEVGAVEGDVPEIPVEVEDEDGVVY